MMSAHQLRGLLITQWRAHIRNTSVIAESTKRQRSWETASHVKFLDSDELIIDGPKNGDGESLEWFPLYLLVVESNAEKRRIEKNPQNLKVHIGPGGSGNPLD